MEATVKAAILEWIAQYHNENFTAAQRIDELTKVVLGLISDALAG